MCQTCNCSAHHHPEHHPEKHHPEKHHSADSHPHSSASQHTEKAATHTIHLHQSILEKNDRLAERNRGYFLAKQVFVLNLLSSPGSGKTALLQRTLQELGDRLKMGVIVGDLETDNDAQRLRAGTSEVIQITTGTVCHLEADMVLRAAQSLVMDEMDILFIENVGNLVCPAAYDLGEHQRIALLSVTEGEDKPLKYPTLFKSADVVVITKIDIAEAVGFERERAIANISNVAPQALLLEVSARTGEGMDDWYRYLSSNLHARTVSVAADVQFSQPITHEPYPAFS
jgi:hydrogenase nickel incorporation protein HypB